MDPISTAALVLRNTQGLSEHASLIIAAGQLIYNYLTEEEKSKPIVNYAHSEHYRDKTRYNELCAARHSLLENGQSLPDEWQLDKKDCPRIKVDFITNAKSFQTHVEALDICSYPQRTAVSGILEIIVKVFTSLAQKEASLITKVNTTEPLAKFKKAHDFMRC